MYEHADFDLGSDVALSGPGEVAPVEAILLFDGVFLLRPELRGWWDLSIYVRASFDVALGRAKARDLPLFGSVATVVQRYMSRYQPGQRQYLEYCQPERAASVVFDNDDPARPTVRL